MVGSRLYPLALWPIPVASRALITLRHHIPRTSVNSLEPYFQQRLLAFGIGLIAVAAFRPQAGLAAVALVGIAGSVTARPRCGLRC